MDEKRTKLIELMESLDFAPSHEEVVQAVSDLKEDELDEMLALYTEIDNYQNDAEDLARQVAPDEYNKIVDDYGEKLKEAEDEYLNTVRRQRQQEDVEMSAQDANEDREIKEIVEIEEEKAQFAESLKDDLNYAIAKVKLNSVNSKDTPTN